MVRRGRRGEGASRRRERPPGRDNAALITAIAAFATALFGSIPEIKDLWPKPELDRQVAISDITYTPGWTYGRFRRETQRPTAGISSSDLNQPGYLVDFRIKLVGYKGKTLIALGFFKDAVTSEVTTGRVPALNRSIIPDVKRVQLFPSIWIPVPSASGKYKAVVEVYNERQRIAETSGPAIRSTTK